jgi:murein DD-endopeptidase MepM/ murein hydrolase activator NlpD
VIRRFEPPAGPYGAGHRGIDIAAATGTEVRASADGIVAFAGKVAGELHVSVDHPDGVRTSYSYLSSVTVRRGDVVARGEVVGSTAAGHPGVAPTHLHFGARFAGQYIDPILLLERGSLVGLIHLAPIEEGRSPGVP